MAWLGTALGWAFGGPVGGGVGGTIDANNAQADAAEQAQAQNADLIQQQMQNQIQSGYTANNLLNNAYPGVQDYMQQGFEGGADFFTQGAGQQRQDILGGGSLAAGAIGQGQGLALDQLYAGAGQGIGYVNSGLESGVGAIGGRTDRMGGMLDQQGGLYGNLQMDPGFEFRRDQGEDALRRMQAARGGRFGGAAGQALLDYNQNFASNEYGNAASRRLQEFGAAQGADAMSLGAQGQLAGLYANAAGQAGQMAYGAGQGGANIYGQGASQLADIYSGTGSQLGAQAGAAGSTLGQMAQDYYGGLGNLDWNMAQQMGQNVMSGAGAAAGMTNQAVANNNSTLPYAGANQAAVAGYANQLTNLAGMYAMGGGLGGLGNTGGGFYGVGA